jgi:hypothetical protein
MKGLPQVLVQSDVTIRTFQAHVLWSRVCIKKDFYLGSLPGHPIEVFTRFLTL